MTLEDHETKRNIVNPYITLYGPDGGWVALNTETFREAQREIIHLHDERTSYKFLEEKRRLYKVVATVGKQDHPFDYETRDIWGRGIRIIGAEDAMALVPLGHILEDVVRDMFPKAYEYFEGIRLRSKSK
ncbi:MAG: hypothetical protein KKH88_04240 [Nanoarchaeota archaeon]|nr:hypothetical protein [Nanoarchaeota archaeon]